MESDNRRGGRLLFLLPYINTALLITVLFVIVYRIGWNGKPNFIQPIMLGCIGGCVLALIVQGIVKEFTWIQAITVLIAIGLIMRIGYMLYTPIYIRYHDLGYLTIDGCGHAGYILQILRNHQLPPTNYFECYHPPLFYFLAACVCGVIEKVVNFADNGQVLEAGKIVTCVASCWCLLLAPKICYQLKMNQRATAIAVAIVALFPNCYLLAGRLNNDSLYIFFVLLAILYTIKWYQKQTWTNTMILAFAIGLGMMTKLSAGTIAFFTGPIMLIIFIKRMKEKNWLALLGKLAAFGALVFPLGLWHSIHHYILYNQPFGYVLTISKDAEIYKGYVSPLKRFVDFTLSNLFAPLYAHPQKDYNINEYIIETSMFGEFEYRMTESIPKVLADLIPRVLVGVNVIMVLLSLYAMYYLIVNAKKLNDILRFGIPALWLVLYGFYIHFNIQYPFGCTMDYRYIVPTAFTGAICIGALFDQMCNKKTTKSRIACIGIATCTTVFCIFSILMYCFIAE